MSHLIDWSPQFTFPIDICKKQKTITVHNDLDIILISTLNYPASGVHQTHITHLNIIQNDGQLEKKDWTLDWTGLTTELSTLTICTETATLQ